MKKWLMASLAFNVAIILFLIGKRIYYYHPPVVQVDDMAIYNAGRNDLLQSLPISTGDIVMVGNSITEGYPFTEVYGKHIKNRGIGGNTTRQIRDRIGRIADYKPRRIILEAGVNDLRHRIPTDTIIANYAAIIALIRQRAPKAQICAESILPTSLTYEAIMPEIKALNASLKRYCDSCGVVYINCYDSVVQNGRLDLAYTYDGLHLNRQGYNKWLEALRHFLK